MKRTAPLVDTEWLQTNATAPNVQIVDATWIPPFLTDRPTGRAQFEAGHIARAVYFDIDAIADPDTDLPHMLPTPALFTEQVRKLGIGNDTHIIVYDSNGFFASARVWWMFRVMGHDAVSVLDGGYEAWLGSGGDIEVLPARVTDREFTSQMRPHLCKDRHDVSQASITGSAAILDARSVGRFDGTQAEPRKGLPSGHIPGSHSVPVETLLTANGRLKPVNELQNLLADYLDQPVITTCGSGVSAAVIALALAKLGKFDASVYDGSWSEWAAHPESVIETK